MGVGSFTYSDVSAPACMSSMWVFSYCLTQEVMRIESELKSQFVSDLVTFRTAY